MEIPEQIQQMLKSDDLDDLRLALIILRKMDCDMKTIRVLYRDENRGPIYYDVYREFLDCEAEYEYNENTHYFKRWKDENMESV